MEMSHGNAFMDCLVRDISYYASIDSDDSSPDLASTTADRDFATHAGDVDEDDDTAAADATVEAAIVALQTAEAPPDGDDCCSICLHDDAEETAAWKRITACGHRFHGACVERWLRVKLSCPVCRHPAAVATVEEILEIYDDYSDSFQTTLRQVMAGPYAAGNSGIMPITTA